MKWDQDFRSFADPLRWWNQTKLHFKHIAIRHAKLNRKTQHHERFLLQNQVEKLHALATNGTTLDIQQYLLAREDFKKLDLKELKGTKIWAKAQEEGERSTRYFSSLEKCPRVKQCIHILTKDHLDIIRETKDLLVETHSFYKSLFAEQIKWEGEDWDSFDPQTRNLSREDKTWMADRLGIPCIKDFFSFFMFNNIIELHLAVLIDELCFVKQG